MDLLSLLTGTKRGWAPNVQQTGVRPDYGLSTATGISPGARSAYERTMAPGQRRTPEELQAMLAEVIMAAGSGALPGVQGQARTRRPPGMRAISQTHPGDLTIKQLRSELKGGSLEWTPVPTSKPWMLRFPDGTALKGFESADAATAWLSKNKIDLGD